MPTVKSTPGVAEFSHVLGDFIDVNTRSPFTPETPIHVKAIVEQQRLRFTMIIQKLIGQDELVRVCQAICKPVNTGNYSDGERYGIIGDWKMPDDIPGGALLTDHVRYLDRDGSWSLFMEHRKRMLALLKVRYGCEYSPNEHIIAENQRQEKELSMMPIARWTTADVSHPWHLRNPSSRRQTELIRQYMNTEGGTSVHPKRDPGAFDSLLGLLSVASLSPEITQTDAWPENMPFQKGGIEQFMGPAQIPVLAIKRQKQLIDSHLIQKVQKRATEELGI